MREWIQLLEQTVSGPKGPVRTFVREDCRQPIVLDTLADPDQRVPSPMKQSHVEKLEARRAVYSFLGDWEGQEERLYLKLYRLRGLKDVLEELLYGKRALRSLKMGLEAEQRGIKVPIHLGAGFRKRPARWPSESVLLMRAVPHNRDVRTVLKHELMEPSAKAQRRRFLEETGRFLGETHRLGLIHGDLKIRNLFVIQIDPPELALIDFDRARFVEADSSQGLFRQALDLRVALRSLGDRVSSNERRRILGAYLRARKLDRGGRARLLRWLKLVRGV
ncbi:MAG: lipopolysaccharide kinase InaA family protein [Planctomycetota bacterium]